MRADLLSPKYFLFLARCPRAACVQAAIPPAVPGRLARPRRQHLGDPEPYERSVAAVLRQVSTYSQPAILGDVAFILRVLVKGATASSSATIQAALRGSSANRKYPAGKWWSAVY
jgi:hypothetical protein